MPLPVAVTFATDICETSSTLGSGTYSLDGARTGYRSFATGYDTNDTPYYVVRSADDTKYEHNRGGIFTDGSPDTLTRNVLYSSNGNAAVVWISGDLPLNVYVPNAAEVFEFMVRGWVMDTRDAWLKFGRWFDSSVSGYATEKLYNGASDVTLGVADLTRNTYALDFKIFPAGMHFVWMNTTIPAGLIELKGQSLVRTDYPALFDHYGTNVRTPADGTHFYIPDMDSRHFIGRNSTGANRIDYAGRNTIGTTFGAQYHSHTVSVSVGVTVTIGGSTSGSIGVVGNLTAAGLTIGNGTGSSVDVASNTNALTGSTSGALGVSGTGSGSGSGAGSTTSNDDMNPGMVGIWVVTTGGV